jgi:tetratricopeptide (TPR) repeat protein
MRILSFLVKTVPNAKMHLPSILLTLCLVICPVAREATAEENDSKGAGTRLALIIGNANYPNADSPLKEPVKDAYALGEELKRDGFEVEVGINLSKEPMQSAFRRFYEKIGRGSIAFVFFSGYGIQSNKQSYMIPIDAHIYKEDDVRRDGFSLDSVLSEMHTRGARAKIAVLDASRRNRFESNFRQASIGLALPSTPPSGTLIMYSAASMSVVRNATGDRSLFVSELIKEMNAPASADEAFNRTRMGVVRATQGEQHPSNYSSLTDDFSFGRPRMTMPAPPAPPKPEPPLIANDVSPQVAMPAPPAPPKPPLTRSPSLDPADPIRDTEKKIKLDPNDPNAWFKLGQLHAVKGDFSAAIMDFDKAISLNPKDPEALNNRCWVRAMVDDLQAALRDCEDALQIRPNFADALDSRGFVNLKSGRNLSAIADFDAALRIKRQASSLYGRGVAKLRSGKIAEGNSDVVAAKVISPDIADEFAKYGIK